MNEQEKFIRRMIWDELERLGKKFGGDIRRKKLRMTDLLLNMAEGKDGTKDMFEYKEQHGFHSIKILFPDYGRLLDMQYYQKRQNYETRDALRALHGIKTKKRDTRWFSKNVYKWIAELSWQLRYASKKEVENNLGNKK